MAAACGRSPIPDPVPRSSAKLQSITRYRRVDEKAAHMDVSAADFSSERLQTLLQDGEFVLCRSSDPPDTRSARRSVLVVMPRSEYPRPQTVRMLEHELALRDELNPAWAIRSLALTTHEGRAALILEDPGGEPLVQHTAMPMDVGAVLRVGAGLAAALCQLHGRGL